MKNTAKVSYDSDRYFITPDRKCEQFLFQKGIMYSGVFKGETGWTYWVYDRDDALNSAIKDYRDYLHHRRTMRSLWRKPTAPAS
jgi:hypothetical protein